MLGRRSAAINDRVFRATDSIHKDPFSLEIDIPVARTGISSHGYQDSIPVDCRVNPGLYGRLVGGDSDVPGLNTCRHQCQHCSDRNGHSWVQPAAEAREGGLYIEDIAPMLGSIRIMEYSEQYGDPTRMGRKAAWLADVRRAVGPNPPVLSAVAVRAKANPDLIRQGVKIAVDSGVRGITLGHYDGAAPSMLRAVWNGMAEAGVRDVMPRLGVEAERMRLDNYFSNPFLLETCINTPRQGNGELHLPRQGRHL